MKFPKWIQNTMTSGGLTLTFYTHGVEAFQLTMRDKTIDLNLLDKELPSLFDLKKDKSSLQSIRNMLTQLKSIARDFRDEGITITISLRGEPVLTIGSRAHPYLLQLVTKTHAIEINNLSKLMELGIASR